MSTHAAMAASASGSSTVAGGSWATSVRTSSGCFATRARAFTAPPLLAKRSTGPAPRVVISRWRSSACSSGVVCAAPSVRLLRDAPRGSYLTTVRSGKCPARVTKPSEPIGEPIKNRTGSLLASFLRTSYARTAPGTSKVWVVGSFAVRVVASDIVGPSRWSLHRGRAALGQLIGRGEPVHCVRTHVRLAFDRGWTGHDPARGPRRLLRLRRAAAGSVTARAPDRGRRRAARWRRPRRVLRGEGPRRRRWHAGVARPAAVPRDRVRARALPSLSGARRRGDGHPGGRHAGRGAHLDRRGVPRRVRRDPPVRPASGHRDPAPPAGARRGRPAHLDRRRL